LGAEGTAFGKKDQIFDRTSGFYITTNAFTRGIFGKATLGAIFEVFTTWNIELKVF
jgi:hypothetical protein